MSKEVPGTEELEGRLGYTFKDKGLLMEALTHKSYHFENISKSKSHNERLEFLGDSVLGLIIASELFAMPESFDESSMSKIKSYVVKGEEISEVAIALGVGEHLRLGKGEDESGGRSKRSLLANAMEALIGAVYSEAGFDEASRLVTSLFRTRLREAIVTEQYKDFKSELQEASQDTFGSLPDYRVVSEEGPEHEKTFSVAVYVNDEFFGQGEGGSKKEAQQAAAREALNKLKSR